MIVKNMVSRMDLSVYDGLKQLNAEYVDNVGTSILGSCVTSTGTNEPIRFYSVPNIFTKINLGTADSMKPWIDHLSVIIDGINHLMNND